MAQAHGERRRTRRPQRELRERAQRDEDGRDEQEQEQEDNGSQEGGAFSQLRGVMSEAAVSVLSPVAKKLATQAAKMAVERGPELLEDVVMPKLQDVGGKLGGLGGALGGGDDESEGGGGAGDGTGKGRRMPIQQSVDVAAPLDVVYDQFTQFEDYPKFMHRVERAEQRDETHVVFSEKIWGVRRQWEAEIVEQVPDERIVWKTVSGMSHVGVVTFHELSDRLTRIELNVDIDPEGPIEKIARGARFAKRAARADLHRFKAFVEMRDEETGAWRGAIEDGEVVDEDDYRDEEEEDEAPEAYEDEESYEDEDAPDDEEEEDDEEPSRRATAKSKSNGGREQKKPASSSSASSRRKKPASSSASSRSRSKSGSGSGSGARKPRAKSTSAKR